MFSSPDTFKVIGINIFGQAYAQQALKPPYYNGIVWKDELVAGVPDGPDNDNFSESGTDSCSGKKINFFITYHSNIFQETPGDQLCAEMETF